MNYRPGLTGALALLLLAACGGEAEEKSATAESGKAEAIAETAIRMAGGGNVDVEIDGDDVRIGDLEISMDTLPEYYPEDVAVYDGAELVNAVADKSGDSIGITWATADGQEKVLAAIETQMEDNGWETEVSLETGNRTVLEYVKDGRIANNMIASRDDKTTISLSTQNE